MKINLRSNLSQKELDQYLEKKYKNIFKQHASQGLGSLSNYNLSNMVQSSTNFNLSKPSSKERKHNMKEKAKRMKNESPYSKNVIGFQFRKPRILSSYNKISKSSRHAPAVQHQEKTRQPFFVGKMINPVSSASSMPKSDNYREDQRQEQTGHF